MCVLLLGEKPIRVHSQGRTVVGQTKGARFPTSTHRPSHHPPPPQHSTGGSLLGGRCRSPRRQKRRSPRLQRGDGSRPNSGIMMSAPVVLINYVCPIVGSVLGFLLSITPIRAVQVRVRACRTARVPSRRRVHPLPAPMLTYLLTHPPSLPYNTYTTNNNSWRRRRAT